MVHLAALYIPLLTPCDLSCLAIGVKLLGFRGEISFGGYIISFWRARISARIIILWGNFVLPFWGVININISIAIDTPGSRIVPSCHPGWGAVSDLGGFRGAVLLKEALK